MPDMPSRRRLPIQGELLPPGERPRCRGCQNELRPNYTYQWDRTRPAGEQIIGKALTGYGIWDRGLFCSKTCATRYAHHHATRSDA